MIRQRIGSALCVALVCAGSAAMLAQQTRPDVLLRAAMETETVKGDLKAAIEQYQAVVKVGSRGQAARALLRMAECYQKLGDARSQQQVDERIVRDYSDQKDAASIARARVGAVSSAATTGDRAIWSGPKVDLFGTVSPNGKLLTYTDWQTNNVMLRDLEAGTARPLTSNAAPAGFQAAGWSAISRDGSEVAYEWHNPHQPTELRLASLRTTEIPEARTLIRLDGSIRPFDWSPDGQSIAVLIERDGASQLGILSIDGKLRTLRSTVWRGAGKVVFSPDGKFIAYDLTPDEARDRSHVFVMAVDGTSQIAVVADDSQNHVMGWAPDGRLLFASNRTGATSLWAASIVNGIAQGDLRIVKPNIGSWWSLGLTSSGTLFAWRSLGADFVRVSNYNATTNTVQHVPGGFQRFVESRGLPDWSAKGKHLLYASCGLGGPCAISVYSTDARRVHNVAHPLIYVRRPRLSPDGSRIVTDGTDSKGRAGIFLIDVATGATTLVARTVPGQRSGIPTWSADGGAIRFQRSLPGGTALFEQASDATEAREIYRLPGANQGPLQASPDGRFVAYVRNDQPAAGVATLSSTLMVVPLSGGAPKAALQARGTMNYWFQWTADSQAIVVPNDPAEGASEIWMVPMVGQPRTLAVDLGEAREVFFQMHPDGRQVAYTATAGEKGGEVWALENILPAKAPSR